MLDPRGPCVLVCAAALAACSSDGKSGEPGAGGGGAATSGGAGPSTSGTGNGGSAAAAPAGGTGGDAGAGAAAGSGGMAGAAGGSATGGMGGAADCLGDAATMAPSDCTNLIYYAVECGDGARALGGERCDYLKFHARRQVFEAVYTCLGAIDIAVPFCAEDHGAAVTACEDAAFERACPLPPEAADRCSEIVDPAACPEPSLERCRSVARSLSATTRPMLFDCYQDLLPSRVDASLTCQRKFDECLWNIDAYAH